MGKSKTIQAQPEKFTINYCEDCKFTKGKDPDSICDNKEAKSYNSRLYYKQVGCLLFKKK
jgi:hypothetical protein